MKSKILLFCGVAALWSTDVLAQSSPGLTYGQVPTPAQWNSYFAAKLDYPGFVPVGPAGGVFTGEIITAPSTATNAGFNIGPGVAPASPNNGDIWVTSAGVFARVAGTNVTLGNANTLTLGGPLTTAGALTTTGTGPTTLAFPSTTVVYTFPTVTATLASLSTADQVVTGGAIVTTLGLTTGNVTIDCGARPIQSITNNGIFTITAPANDSSCILLVTNGAAAGTITFSGFTVGASTGDPLTTTNTNKFTISIWRAGGVAGYRVAAHQ